jgi:hypothetical protein
MVIVAGRVSVGVLSVMRWRMTTGVNNLPRIFIQAHSPTWLMRCLDRKSPAWRRKLQLFIRRGNRHTCAEFMG